MSLSERICSATMFGLSSFLKASLTDASALSRSLRRLHLDARHASAVCILVDDVWSRDIFTNDCGFRSARRRLVNNFIGRFGGQLQPFFIAVLVDKFLDVLFRGANGRGGLRSVFVLEVFRRNWRGGAATESCRDRFGGCLYLDLSSCAGSFVVEGVTRCTTGGALWDFRQSSTRPPEQRSPQPPRRRRRQHQSMWQLERPAPTCTPSLLLPAALAARASGPLSVRPALLVRISKVFFSFFLSPVDRRAVDPPSPARRPSSPATNSPPGPPPARRPVSRALHCASESPRRRNSSAPAPVAPRRFARPRPRRIRCSLFAKILDQHAVDQPLHPLSGQATAPLLPPSPSASRRSSGWSG